MSVARSARRLTLVLWAAVALSLPAWMTAGYSRSLCLIAVLPLFAVLNGLARGRRDTYAWAILFTIPYIVFSITELLANPAARWVASISLLLVFGWFCAMVLFLRVSPARRE